MYTTSIFSLKRTVVVLLVTLMGGVILSSCNQDEGTQLPINTIKDNKHILNFKVNLGSNWGEKTAEKKSLSRGTPYDYIVDPFGIYGGYYNAADVNFQTMNYMWNTEGGESETGWQTAEAFTNPPMLKEMSFYAYYPYLHDEDTIRYIRFNNNDTLKVGPPFFDFVIPDSVPIQPDLMVATSQMKSDSLIKGDTIMLHFSHLLTAVRFTVDASVPKGILKEISIENVSKGGSFYYEDGTNDWRALNDTLVSYTLKKEYNVGGAKVSLDDEDAFLMMPQFLGQDAQVRIVYDNGQVFNLTSSLAEKHWEKGKIVTYNIKINSLSYMTLTATIEPWEVGDTFNWNSSY